VNGIPVFGPGADAARIEGSKSFAKDVMRAAGIPIPETLSVARAPCVVKADGLASGKGVVVAAGVDDARAVLTDWYGQNRIPGGGSDVLLEEKLEGREVSVFAISDGRAMFPIASACDYKRAGDGDTGPNTGGMGAYSPPKGFPAGLEDQVRERILAPVLRGLLAEGEQYIGVLYCGLMWADDGPYVIEFNARFGDPETQVLMPRVTGDFGALLKSAADGAVDLSAAAFATRACVGVVIATADYPRSSTPLSGLPLDVDLGLDAQVFWGGSTVENGAVSSGGGRVLTVTGLGNDLIAARLRAYDAVHDLAARFNARDLTYRTDIAKFNG